MPRLPRGGRAVKIVRTRHETHFTILPNALLRDTRLSLRARGLLVELLSRPDDWQTSADAMARTARRDRGRAGEGRDAMRGAFAELETARYIVRTRSQNASGEWTTELVVYDIPQGREERNTMSHRDTENQSSVYQASVDQSSESQASLRSTDDGSTDVRSTEDEESAELADARSRSIASDRASEETHTQHVDDELMRRYTLVRQLPSEQLREALHAFEKRRPRIYRECRQRAIEQYQESGQDPHAVQVDQLSYMYAVMHYWRGGVTPMCLAKPIGIAS